MSKKVKIFAFVVLGLAILVGVITFFSGSKSSSSATVSPTAMPAGVAPGTARATSGLTSSAASANLAPKSTSEAPVGMPIAGNTAILPGGGPGMTSAGALGQSANEFSALLSSVSSVTIDTSIFANPAYKALRDFPISLGVDVVGRINPFAPVGADANASTPQAIVVQTLQPGKISSTTAELGATITLPDTTPATVVFQYGITDTFGSATAPVAVTKTGTILNTITTLTPGTTYYVQAVAVQGSITTVGNTMTFTTTTPVTTPKH